MYLSPHGYSLEQCESKVEVENYFGIQNWIQFEKRESNSLNQLSSYLATAV